MTDIFKISKKSISKIDKEILKYPVSRKSSAVMAALTIIQTEKKWLDTDAIKFVAGYLEIPKFLFGKSLLSTICTIQKRLVNLNLPSVLISHAC